MKVLKVLLLSALVILCVPAQTASSVDTSLGIGLTIIPINDGTNANLSFNNQLWFGIEQGKSFTRQFQVSSASAIPQRLTFELFDVIYENGARNIRTDRASLTSAWVSFSPNNVVIPARGSVQVSMTYAIPAAEEDAAFESFLRVNASAANLPIPGKSSGGVQVILPGSAAIDTPVWLGIGDPQSLISDFEIKKVFGALINGEKKLRIIIKNSGKTPLGLDGTVQLTDATFTERTFGPFNYRTAEIKPGTEVAVDVVMPEEVTEGSWKLFIVAEQGNIRKSKVFEEDLTFRPLGSTRPIRLLLGLLALVGMFFGWKLLRSPKHELSKEKETPTAAQIHSKNKVSERSELDHELDEFLEKLLDRQPKPSIKKTEKRNKVSKKAAVAKKPQVKKKAVSQTVKKKATAKKAPVKKKATAKKALAKKKS